MAALPGMIVWGRSEQAAMIRAGAAAAHAQIIAAGAVDSDEAARLAEALDTDRFIDLREAPQFENADIFWLADGRDVDANMRSRIAESFRVAITSEPDADWPAPHAGELERDEPLTFAPLMRHGPASRALADVIPEFGEAQAAWISLRSAAEHGSLFARLYDALDLMLSFTGPAESIDGVLAAVADGSAESLHAMHGHLAINVRFKSGCAASATVSSASGPWSRGVTLIGERGCVRMTDAGFEWIDHDGRTIDSHRAPALANPGELVGEKIARMLLEHDATDVPPNHRLLLALCEAARLSCLTGQHEAPARMVEMLSRP